MSKGIAVQHRTFGFENQKPMRTLLTLFLISLAGSCLGQLSATCYATNGYWATNCLGVCYVEAEGGTPPYTYSWSNGGTTDSVVNLQVGTYSVTVTDANGFSATCSQVIDENCCNVTDGGIIGENEEGCGFYDAELIYSDVQPLGGEGDLEIVWLRIDEESFTTNPIAWTVIPGSNSLDYDPGVITETTHFMRVSRRAGCSAYVGESNIITKTVWPTGFISIYPVGSSVICNGEPAILATQPSPDWTWSTGEHSGQITVSDTGFYWVTNWCGDTSDLFYVGMAELDAPIIEETDSCTFQISNYSDSLSYQWLLNGNPINNSTGEINADSLHGYYSVVATSTNGCVLESNELFCFNNTSIDEQDKDVLKIYPNPVNDQLFIKTEERFNRYSIFSILGEMVQSGTIRENPSLDVSNLDGGLYVIRLNGESGEAVRRFVKVD